MEGGIRIQKVENATLKTWNIHCAALCTPKMNENQLGAHLASIFSRSSFDRASRRPKI